MDKKLYKGVVVPTVTPFDEHGNLDITGAENLIEHIVSNNCSPFILGTTGEALSTDRRTKEQFIKTAARVNNGRNTFYAGIASMCLADSVELANMFFNEGADVVVANLPSYYKLSDSSVLRYFIDLADKINGPLMIYNITATTQMSIPISTIDFLSNHPNIVGLKDSERDEERMHALLKKYKDNPEFSYQLGWAAKSVEFLRNGGDGIVPSTGNAYPDLYYLLYESVQNGDYMKANELQELTNNISGIYQKDKLLSEALPGLKVILEHLGICKANALAPCYSLNDNQVDEIKNAIAALAPKLY